MIDKVDLINAYAEMFPTNNSYAITLTFNYNCMATPQYLMGKLAKYDAAVNRDIFGSRFYKKPVTARPFILLIPEKLDSYQHYHGAIYIPPVALSKIKKSSAEDVLINKWRELVPAGSIDCKPLTNPTRWLSYMAKHSRSDLGESLISPFR